MKSYEEHRSILYPGEDEFKLIDIKYIKPIRSSFIDVHKQCQVQSPRNYGFCIDYHGHLGTQDYYWTSSSTHYLFYVKKHQCLAYAIWHFAEKCNRYSWNKFIEILAFPNTKFVLSFYLQLCLVWAVLKPGSWNYEKLSFWTMWNAIISNYGVDQFGKI